MYIVCAYSAVYIVLTVSEQIHIRVDKDVTTFKSNCRLRYKYYVDLNKKAGVQAK